LSNLARINENYNEKVDLLKATEVELEGKLRQLDQSTQALSLKTEREATFTQKYSSVKEEKETLEQTKARLEKNVDNLEGDLQSKAREVQDLSGRLAISEVEIEKVGIDRDEFEKDFKRYRKLYNGAQAELTACQAG